MTPPTGSPSGISTPLSAPSSAAEDDILSQLNLDDNGGNDNDKQESPRSNKHTKSNPYPNPKPKPKPKTPSNPLQIGILNFLNTKQQHQHHPPALPKRFTIYPPLLLLPSNAFSSPPEWAALYASLPPPQRQELYACIASSFASKGVTHIAMNAPIAPTMGGGDSAQGGGGGVENRIRSPMGLVPLFGDFGEGEEEKLGQASASSSSCLDGGVSVGGGVGGPSEEEKEAYPTQAALKSALWVRCVQNQGVVQVWAPLHSMFSRGNVVEKARILGLEGTFEGLDGLGGGGGRGRLDQSLSDVSVVDMYAGIGYFVFSYLKRGVGRVWGWEINGWSIEGLRRGCEENGWGVRIVRVDRGSGKLDVEGGFEGLVDSLSEEDRAVVFHGDNRFAADVLGRVKGAMERKEKGNMWKPIRHVNLGLLPTSKPAWDGAVRILDAHKGGWVHVHENVDGRDIEKMEKDVVQGFNHLIRSPRGSEDTKPAVIPKAECVHVERVKTYAPGVMHCVFDIYIPPGDGQGEE
ncbi:hypothetical protein FQN50_005836 [Emmonsiellopsis sp. PD_5]|nr:hypothetical protein FQN50_005836 [Emmonsiellopsis sp. PD_5]